MMKPILLFSLLLFAQGLSAQNLKVTVRDADQQPLGYGRNPRTPHPKRFELEYLDSGAVTRKTIKNHNNLSFG
jgi:hypothetical protein